jgi:tRNA dimethylallyltransferase
MYRELRILTARPTPQEEARAEHKLYGVLPASENCSAGKWLKLAKMEIDWVLGQQRLPIVVGGTGLYIKALMEGIPEMPDIPPEVRLQSMNDFEQMGKDAFAARLRDVDPEFFTRLSVYDKQRLTRAYEVWLGTGRPLSWWQKQTAQPFYPAHSFDIRLVDIPREELYIRCDERFSQMIANGAIDEVKALIGMNLPGDLPAMKSVGVREIAAYVKGDMSLKEATEKAQQATRNYAKRQLTWFRNQLAL